MRLICLTSRGHYPERFLMVSEEDFQALKAIEVASGCLYCGSVADGEHVKEILARSKKADIPVILEYC